MKLIAERYRKQLSSKEFIISCLIGLALLVASLVINYFAAAYAILRESNSVSDIILSNIPVFNVDDIFVYGPLVFWAILAFISLQHPQKIPFILKSIALFVVVRSIFITLTHIGPYPDHVIIEAGSTFLHALSSKDNFFLFSSGGDLFFSGHTGLPFLMALVFWKEKWLRAFCLFAALFFGVVVLLGHLHYTIDVISAFFITYTVYHIGERLFARDRRLFYSS